MKKTLSLILAFAMCFCLATGAFASGEASGSSSSGMAGMLSMESYVVENDGSDTVTFGVYGIFEAGGEDDAAAYVIADADPASLTYVVYADRAMTEEAAGVTASVADGILTVAGVDTVENTPYYIGNDFVVDGAATPIYVVNDQYAATVDYDLNDGTTIALSAYAPGAASNSKSPVYIGCNTTLLSAADYGITDEPDATIADWWLGSGVTNAGSTLFDFGDEFYRFELSVTAYRLFQIVVDQNTTIGADFVDPTDSNGAMGSNDQYSDSISATIYAGVWDGIYTVMNDDGYLENIDGVTALDTGAVVDEETLFVVLYNAFVSPWSQLTEEGQAIAAGLNATTAAEKVEQMKAALGMEDWAVENYTTQKLACLDVLMAAAEYVTPKTMPGAELQSAIEAAGYAIVDTATADMVSLQTLLSATQISEDTEIVGEDLTTDLPTSVFITGGHVSIVDSTIVSSGSNTAAGTTGESATDMLGIVSGSPSTSTKNYNLTMANAPYRMAYGADLIAWGYDTVVDITTTTGELVISAPSGGSMAGGMYNGFGGSIYVHNASAFSAGQHLSNTLYNGTIHYYQANAIGSGRMYSSDFWGGNVVFEDSISSGGDVTDEPTSVIVKNGIFKGTASMNGYATMYFENAYIEGGNFATQNNTSLVSDAANFTLVNSVMDGSSFLTVGRSSRAIATIVDSKVILSGNTLAKLSNGSYGPGNLGEDFTEMFQTEAMIRVYGDNSIYFDGDQLQVDVAADQTLVLYVNEIVGGDIVNVGEGSFEIVAGDEYGTLYLNTEAPAASGEASAEAAVEDEAYPYFDEFRDYVAEYALADDFMSGQTGIPEDIYTAETPYVAPFCDINSVIGAMDYPDWMNANYPGVAFAAE